MHACEWVVHRYAMWTLKGSIGLGGVAVQSFHLQPVPTTTNSSPSTTGDWLVGHWLHKPVKSKKKAGKWQYFQVQQPHLSDVVACFESHACPATYAGNLAIMKLVLFVS